MSHRSKPQPKIDDAGFPIRVCLRMPGKRLGRNLDALHRWLADNLGHAEYAVHAGGGVQTELHASSPAQKGRTDSISKHDRAHRMKSPTS